MRRDTNKINRTKFHAFTHIQHSSGRQRGASTTNIFTYNICARKNMFQVK